MGNQNSMRFRKFLFFLIISVIIQISVCFASQPTEIKINYNPDFEVLSTFIIHPVEDQNQHYIESIMIYHNNDLIFNKNFSSQQNSHDQLTETFFPKNPNRRYLQKHDKIQIIIKCNYGETLTEEYKILELPNDSLILKKRY